MEKQDTNENERECESETVDHIMVVSTEHVFVLESDFNLKAGLILIKKLKQLQTGCYAFIDP